MELEFLSQSKGDQEKTNSMSDNMDDVKHRSSDYLCI